MRICELIPEAETLLRLETEELAGVLLMHLNSRDDADLYQDGLFASLTRNPEYVTSKTM